MNITSLLHPTTQANIFAAMQRARLSSLRGLGGQAYITNSKGQRFLRVKHTRGTGGGFTFATNKLVSHVVKAALRSAL